jgi:hypothetical protein
MASKQGTRLFSGNTEVVTAQTPVQLSTTNPEGALIGVWVAADPSNTGTLIAIGGKGIGMKVDAKKTIHEFVGIPLEKKQGAIFLECISLSEVWVDVETSKDCVTWTAVVA